MSMDYRIDRLLSSLRADERVHLVLDAYKSGAKEDPMWRKTMPASQYGQFNGAIGAINAANVQLTALIALLNSEVDKLHLRLALLFCLAAQHTDRDSDEGQPHSLDILQAIAQASEPGETPDGLAQAMANGLVAAVEQD